MSTSDEVVNHQTETEMIVITDHIGASSIGMCRGNHDRNAAHGLDKRGKLRHGADDEHRLDVLCPQRIAGTITSLT